MHDQRTCSRCGETKPVSEFYVRRYKTTDGVRVGLQTHCKPCDARSRRERRIRDDQAAKDRRRYAEDPAFMARRVTTNRARKQAGVPARAGVRRLRERLFREAQGICAVCGDPMTFEESSVDHVTPISRGGKHEPTNVQIAHRVCNSVKGTR